MGEDGGDGDGEAGFPGRFARRIGLRIAKGESLVAGDAP